MRAGCGGGTSRSSTSARPDDPAPVCGSGPALPPRAPQGGARGLQNEEPERERAVRHGKTYLRLASLNMRGAGRDGLGGVGEKWMRVNQILRENRIAVLAVQETHLSDDRVAALNALFGEYMSVFPSAYPGNETGACGVAFVINRRILKSANCLTTEIIPGRVLMLDLNWPEERPLRIVNVYGPNIARENAAMWETLRGTRLREGNRQVDVLLGDFNVVDDPIDRLPARLDSACAVEALRGLVEELRVRDGWREQNPNAKSFTYLHAANGSQSRLDRIYTRAVPGREVDDWGMKESGLDSDHKMITASLYNNRTPFVGKGRWVMPKHLLTDEQLVGEMKRLAAVMATEMDALMARTDGHNPQTIYAAFKRDLIRAVRARAKEKIPRMQRQIEALRADLQATLNSLAATPSDVGGEDGVERQQEHHAAVLQDRLLRLERKRFESARRMVAVKQRLYQETMTKQWTRS
ncbi:Endonuclease/exonuclease/phosphatase, partial [Cubamyces lactineus]